MPGLEKASSLADAESGRSTRSTTRPALKSLVIRGSTWVLISHGGRQVLRLIGNLIFARLLFPEAFGIMALVNVYLQGLGMFTDMGVRASIIQDRRGKDRSYLNTAWTIQVIRGGVIWICASLGSIPFARLYGVPELAWILPVAGLTAVISGFTTTRWFTRQRDLSFGSITLIETGSQLIMMLSTVSMCLVWPSVWALVWGALVAELAKVTLGHALLTGPRDRFAWERESVRKLVGFGKWIFLSSLITFLAQRLDRLLLGSFIPLDLLGVYCIAGNLANLPVNALSGLATTVWFPVLSKQARTAPAMMVENVVKTRRLVLAISLLATLCLVLGAPLFFGHLYDDRYVEAGWMAQLLGASVWITVLSFSLGSAVLALGDSRSIAVKSACQLVAAVTGSVVGHLMFGLPGFIVGLSCGPLAAYIVLVTALVRRKISVVRQDLAYTGLLAVLSAVALTGPDVVSLLVAVGTLLWVLRLLSLEVWQKEERGET